MARGLGKDTSGDCCFRWQPPGAKTGRAMGVQFPAAVGVCGDSEGATAGTRALLSA